MGRETEGVGVMIDKEFKQEETEAFLERQDDGNVIVVYFKQNKRRPRSRKV